MLSEALVTLLLKKDKDPLCSSSRPISLLNIDFKILVKVLAGYLQRVLPALIDPDQTGFISGRHSSSNSRLLLNILFSPSTDLPEMFLSLDAEKAFDCVEWRYLFYVFNKFGLGSGFVAWIKFLYASPVASVCTNGIRSESFSLHRGTCQD